MNITDNSTYNYRYAYQGQEKDPETGKEAFELRLWDSRIGRWLTTDPAHEFHSPYLGMGNNSVKYVDVRGDTIRLGSGLTQAQWRNLKPKIAKAWPVQFNYLDKHKIDIFFHFQTTPLTSSNGTALDGVTNVDIIPPAHVYMGSIGNNNSMNIDVSQVKLYEKIDRNDGVLSYFFTKSISYNNAHYKYMTEIEITKIDVTFELSSSFKTIGHEMGHAYYNLRNPFSFWFWSTFERMVFSNNSQPSGGKGHHGGNPSGGYANFCENMTPTIYINKIIQDETK